MEEKINQVLAQLENDLQSLVSARKQVENTMNASNKLNIIVEEYINSIKNVCLNLKEWDSDLQHKESIIGQEITTTISNMQQACTSITSSFYSTVNNTKDSFENGTKEALKNFANQNNKLSESIKELKELDKQIKKINDNLADINRNLNQKLQEIIESQNKQDSAINDIKQIVSSLSALVQRERSIITKAISYSENALMDKTSQVDRKVHNLTQSIENISLKIDKLSIQCNNIIQKISSTTNSIESAIKESKQDMIKYAKINGGLIIATLIILAVIKFIFK